MDGSGNAWAKPTIAEVQKVVCVANGLTMADMKTKLRTHRLAHPRQEAMALAREMCGKSYPQLGRAFGGRDHSTCIFAVRKIARLVAINPNLEIKLARYREQIMDLIASRPAPVNLPPQPEPECRDWRPRVRKLSRPQARAVLDVDAWESLGGVLEDAA